MRRATKLQKLMKNKRENTGKFRMETKEETSTNYRATAGSQRRCKRLKGKNRKQRKKQQIRKESEKGR